MGCHATEEEAIHMQCNAKTRAGTPCQQPAGWGTDHPGAGRCKLHGGRSLCGHLHPRFRGGRYAMYSIDVFTEPGRRTAKANDATVAFDDRGRCRGTIRIGKGPRLDQPIPLRAEDIEAFRHMPGFEVALTEGLGWYTEARRTIMRGFYAREKERKRREAEELEARRLEAERRRARRRAPQ